jgi:hypothetical protein
MERNTLCSSLTWSEAIRVCWICPLLGSWVTNRCLEVSFIVKVRSGRLVSWDLIWITDPLSFHFLGLCTLKKNKWYIGREEENITWIGTSMRTWWRATEWICWQGLHERTLRLAITYSNANRLLGFFKDDQCTRILRSCWPGVSTNCSQLARLRSQDERLLKDELLKSSLEVILVYDYFIVRVSWSTKRRGAYPVTIGELRVLRQGFLLAPRTVQVFCSNITIYSYPVVI